MRYFVRMPDGQEREWELPALEAACREGSIRPGALVRSELQDFWYPVAELLGMEPTRPLHFFCSRCRCMIHSRRIDMGHPIECPECKMLHQVPDVRRRPQRPRPTSPLDKARSRVILGTILLLIGVLPVAYWYFHPKPGYNADQYPMAFTLVIYAGLALVVMNWRKFRRGEEKNKV